MPKLASSIAIGTTLQILMVLAGHYAPTTQQAGLFPIAGTLIGGVTGWLTGAGATAVVASGRGATAGCIAGIVGSVVSTSLGGVPLANADIAGGATLVAGALGALIHRKLDQVRARGSQT